MQAAVEFVLQLQLEVEVEAEVDTRITRKSRNSPSRSSKKNNRII